MRLLGPSLGSVLVALVMLAAAAANLYQFADIDARTPRNLRALHALDSFDIIELGLNLTNVRNTMNLYAAVGRKAAGAPLVLTSPELNRRGKEFRARMLGLGLVRRIELCEAGSEGLELKPSIELQKGEVWLTPGEARRKKPGTTWALATSSAPPKRLIQLRTPEADVLIVDEALLAGGDKVCP